VNAHHRHLPFKLKTLFASICFLNVLNVQHVSASNDMKQLDTLVVTATRSEKKLMDSPIRTEVLSAQELERTHALTLKDALENIPGILMREIHGKSGYEVSLQGMTSDQVLILIDGLPLAASTSSTVDLEQYLVAGIERIEVIKGASSAQYGSSAMGGVINIITQPVQAGLVISAQMDMGSYGKQNATGKSASINNHHEKLQIDAASGAFKARIIADQLNNDGFAVNPDAYPLQGDIQERKQYALYTAWQPSDDFLAWFDFNQYDEHDQQRSEVFITPNVVKQHKKEEIERQRVSAGSQFQMLQHIQADIKAVHESYTTTSTQTTDHYLSARRHSEQENNHLSSQFSFAEWQKQKWQLGYDWHQEKLQQSNNGKFEMQGGEVSRDRHEIYLQNDIAVTPKLDVVLGWRLQDDEDFGHHNAFKLSSKYRFYQQNERIADLRFSYGQGYRVPNLKERFYSFDHSHLGYVVIGNPNLKPESSDSFQLGVQWVDKQLWNADLNLFLNEVDGLIQTDFDNASTVNGITQYTYSNVAKAQTYGLESTAQWFVTPNLTLNAAYTYTHTQDKATNHELTRRPKHIARLGWDYQINEPWSWSVRSRYQSSEFADSQNKVKSPDWFAVDSQFDYQIIPQLSLFFGMDNIFDTQRDFNSMADYRPIAGRYTYTGLRFNWQVH
jgi:outer membrane receptor for ferrienterochelin and colicins